MLMSVVAAAAVAGDGPNPPWYPSLMASEHYDSGRTHLFEQANFNGSFNRLNQVDVLQSPADQPYLTPYNVVYRNADSMFIYGGGYGDKGGQGAYIAKVDPKTLQRVWFKQLILTGDNWNYPGVAGILKDGFIYVIYGTQLAKVDPKDGSYKTLTLPTPQQVPPALGPSPWPSGDTSYNGFDALPDGTIIAKTVYREYGCTEQGFDAFLDCDQPQAVPKSILVAIDPEKFEIIGQPTEAAEYIVGRVTTTRFNGTNYVYLAGSNKVYRYIYDNGQFQLDSTFGKPPGGLDYLPSDSGQNTASALIVMNNWVVFTTNGGPVKANDPVQGVCENPGTPQDPHCTSPWLTLWAIDQAHPNSNVHHIQPFAQYFPSPPGYDISFAPSSVSVDPLRNRIFAFDAGPGKIAAIDLQPDGTFQQRWIVDQWTTEFMALIGPQNRRVLVTTEIPSGQLPGFNTDNYVVWLDADTGNVLAKSHLLQNLAVNTGTMIEPGYGGDMYYMVQPNPAQPPPPQAPSYPPGSIIKLSVRPTK
jgi:hypothetical protein